MKHWCVLLAVLSLAGMAAGCGGDSGTTRTQNGPAKTGKPAPPPKADVTQVQIKQSPQGTPERTVLEWWRDVQLNDPEHARQLYLEPPPLPDLAGQFNFVGGRLAGSVKVLSTEETEDPARVRVQWTTPQGNDRQVTLRLSEEEGGWKLLDARFLDEMVAQLQQDGAGG